MRRTLLVLALAALGLSVAGCEDAHDYVIAWQYSPTPDKEAGRARIVEVYDSVFLHSGLEHMGARRVVTRDVYMDEANSLARTLMNQSYRVLSGEDPAYDEPGDFEVAAYLLYGSQKLLVTTHRYAF